MKLHVWLLLVLLSVPQAGHGETPASSADHIDGLLILHSRSISRQYPRLVLDLPQTVLFAGDSIMEELGPALAQMLAGKKTLKLVQAGRSSTGLCRPDFYDWPKAMRALMRSEHPRTVVICIGANDDQTVADAGVRHQFISPRWQVAYRHKVEELINIIEEYGGISIWVSPPIMGPDTLRPRVFAIKEVIRQTCESKNVPFIDIWPTLADTEGNFQYSFIAPGGKTIKLRTRDGVHIAPEGNKILAKTVLPYLESILQITAQPKGYTPPLKNTQGQ